MFLKVMPENLWFVVKNFVKRSLMYHKAMRLKSHKNSRKSPKKSKHSRACFSGSLKMVKKYVHQKFCLVFKMGNPRETKR